MVGYVYINPKKKKRLFYKNVIFRKLDENRIEIQVNIDEKKDKNKNLKFAKKIVKKLKKKKIDSIILEDKIYTNFDSLLYTFNESDISIITGNELYEEKINEIIEYILEYLQSIKIEEINLGIMINTLSYSRLKFIKEMANKVKGISILSDYTEKFEQISKEIMEETGLSLKTSNNYKNGLKGCALIVNFDFFVDKINNAIYNNCIFINLKDKIKKVRSGFNGILINDINLKINKDNFKNLDITKFRNLALIQSIKQNEKPIDELVGIRGIINLKEIESFKAIKRKK